jgi:RimJ/RimL family protein N-acetyltransferase
MARLPRKQPSFTTKRLRLRPFRAGLVEAMHALYRDVDSLRYWSTPAGANLDATRRMMRWHLAYRPRYYVMWAVEESKSRKVIGMINYHLREQRCDVGWLILPQHQGKGYMTEAGRALLGHVIGDLGVHKVEALIRPDNKPSRALAERLGFRLEGGPIPRSLAGRRQVA